MTFRTKTLSWAATVAFVSLLGVSTAKASTITYGFTGTDTDGAISATAGITTGTNLLTVVLTNNQGNPKGDAQQLSGIFITLSTTPTGSPTFNSESGNLISIGSGGVVTAVTPGLNTTDSHWGTSLTGATVCLETAGTCAQGGQPDDLIIGDNGSFSNANNSIINHQPSIDGKGTFVLNLAGINSDTRVTGVTFVFGTSAISETGTPVDPSVPEPSSLALLGTGIVGAAGLVRRRLGARK